MGNLMVGKKDAEAKTRVSAQGSEDISWQAQKSAMTRDRILDAAINCFIEIKSFGRVHNTPYPSSTRIERH